jgi:hypothetical protein
VGRAISQRLPPPLLGAFSIQVVPEPGAFALLVPGLLSLLRLGSLRRPA